MREDMRARLEYHEIVVGRRVLITHWAPVTGKLTDTVCVIVSKSEDAYHVRSDEAEGTIYYEDISGVFGHLDGYEEMTALTDPTNVDLHEV
jgi:hypothetical protein